MPANLTPSDYRPIVHNFRTGQDEPLPDVTDDENAPNYFPPMAAAINLYQVCRLQGETPRQALISVLRILAG